MRIIFMGRRPHSIEALSWLLQQGHEVVRVVAPSGTGDEAVYWSPRLRDFAEARGLPVTCDTALYDELSDGRARAALEPVDLVVSFLFWKRVKRPIIDLPRSGCVNFHPAPLPEYQGVGGYNFAILEKRQDWAATAHYVDEGFDTGPIIEVRAFNFDWRTATAFSLERATRPVILELFRDVVSEIARRGWLPTRPNVGGRYITRDELEAAKRVDLGSLSSQELDLRARAFWYPPFDGAYVEEGGERFTLVSRAILQELRVLHDEDTGARSRACTAAVQDGSVEQPSAHADREGRG